MLIHATKQRMKMMMYVHTQSIFSRLRNEKASEKRMCVTVCFDPVVLIKKWWWWSCLVLICTCTQTMIKKDTEMRVRIVGKRIDPEELVCFARTHARTHARTGPLLDWGRESPLVPQTKVRMGMCVRCLRGPSVSFRVADLCICGALACFHTVLHRNYQGRLSRPL